MTDNYVWGPWAGLGRRPVPIMVRRQRSMWRIRRIWIPALIAAAAAWLAAEGGVMRPVPSNHSHLWNDLPYEERTRLHPFMIERHILHLEQTRAKIVAGHERTLREIDSQIANLKSDLPQVSP